MLSLVTHTGYEEGDIAEKIYSVPKYLIPFTVLITSNFIFLTKYQMHFHTYEILHDKNFIDKFHKHKFLTI